MNNAAKIGENKIVNCSFRENDIYINLNLDLDLNESY